MAIGTELFDRKVRITAGTTQITGLRMGFEVKRSLTKDPNTAKITVYNLNQEHRAALQAQGLRILVEAGYGSDIAVIFNGTIRTATSTHQGPDWITQITSGDGEIEYRTARVVENFKPGTPIKTIIKTVCQRIGLPSDAALKAIDASTFRGGVTQAVNGMSVTGPAERVLTNLLAGAGLEWSIQDGVIQVVPLGQSTNADAVLLNRDTGLVGSPDIGETGKTGTKRHVVKITSLLNAKISPGRKISLDAVLLKGFYRAEKITHTGDTHDKPFYTVAECKSL